VADPAILAAEDVVKDYRIGRYCLRVLHGVSLRLRRGEFLGIVGPSGAGKSTLLHVLGLLDTATEGRVLHEGRDLARLSPVERAAWRNRTVGFVFQFYHLLPDFSALENVAMPGLVRAGILAGKQLRRLARQRAERVLETVGLGERMRHRPGQLSGGERQRLAELLQSLREQSGCTLVMVTHDEKIAAKADRIAHLVDGRMTR